MKRDKTLPIDRGRRSTLGKISLACSALFFGTWKQVGRAAAAARRLADPIFETIVGLVPEVTPNSRFYKISKNLWDPNVPVERWSLSVEGLVEKPFTLTYEELKALPSKSQYTTLCCISNEVGGSLISNAKWGGIPLREVLLKAGLKDEISDVRLEAYDGYTESIPVEKAMHPDTLLAWTMNDAPLPPDHGFPARLVVPGIYGMKNVKWITKIAPVSSDFKGFWERRGWSDEAVIKTMSRIDVPKNGDTVGAPGDIGGIAFAGDRGIARVEVSYDQGHSWEEAHVKEALSPYTWVLWATRPETMPPGPTIMVRAVDKTGAVQTAQTASPLPDGSSGYHSIHVRWRR